jgi:hypothetical protein
MVKGMDAKQMLVASQRSLADIGQLCPIWMSSSFAKSKPPATW